MSLVRTTIEGPGLARARNRGEGTRRWWGALVASVLTVSGSLPAVAQDTPAPAAPTSPEPAAPTSPAPAPASPAPASPEPANKGRDGKEFQDWTLHCETAEGKPEACEMRERVVDQHGNRVLLAVVGRLPQGDSPGMLILLPLGIALPPGTFITIDQGDRQPVSVERCEKEGCRVEVLLKPDLLARLKAGTRAVVSFHIYDHQGKRPQVDVPISLLGFSAALAEVMK